MRQLSKLICAVSLLMLAQLVFQPRHHIAGRVGRHDEGAHALLAGALVGDGDDDGDMAVLAAGDELLDAVDHIVVAVLHRRGAQGRGVAAHMRLGQAERAQHLALRQRRQPLLFLRGVAVAHQDGVDRAVGHADRGAGAAVAGGDFFQHQRQRQVVEVGAAELLGHADAVGAQRGQALVRFLRESGAPCPSARRAARAAACAKARTASRIMFLVVIEYQIGLLRMMRLCSQLSFSKQFDRHRRAFAAADAQRGDAASCRPRAFSACISVTMMRAPLRADRVAQRAGAAVDVDDVVRDASARAISAIGTTAKASLTSHRSTSSTLQPVLASSLCDGADRRGGEPVRAPAHAWRGRRCGPAACSPARLAVDSRIITSAAAPSLMDELEAAVMVPSFLKAGLSVGILSSLTLPGPSSMEITVSPARPLTVTGVISAAKAPRFGGGLGALHAGDGKGVLLPRG